MNLTASHHVEHGRSLGRAGAFHRLRQVYYLQYAVFRMVRIFLFDRLITRRALMAPRRERKNYKA